jgi:hypothetical protein
MKHIKPRIRSFLFGCAVVSGLAFGTSQALATPAERDVPRVCDPRCKLDCDGFGGELRHWGCLCCG